MSVPGPWQALLLALAAYRVFRLLAEDTILDRPRAWLIGVPPDWEPDDPVPASYRERLDEFLGCAWCSGFHLCLVLWVAWLIAPLETVALCVPLSLSAAVGLTARFSSTP